MILNDNRMAIDPNVGALKEYLLSISTSKRYNKVKNRTWTHLERMPRLRGLIQKVGGALKQGFLQQSNLFESLHFRYFGPVDGHDVVQLTRVLGDLKEIPGPKLLHVLTVKGKGYPAGRRAPADMACAGHIQSRDRGADAACRKRPSPALSGCFRRDDSGARTVDDRIVGITPAMPTGCSLNRMMAEMPERCFDVGIAEGHAVTFSAGLAAAGMIPFCNIYSSFMQRAYDNVIHDVALQHLNVVMCLDRAGLVGEDGPTHHGVFDIACMRSIPNLTIASPMNEIELRNLMYTASLGRGPFVIRYPKGEGRHAAMAAAVRGGTARAQPVAMRRLGRGRADVRSGRKRGGGGHTPRRGRRRVGRPHRPAFRQAVGHGPSACDGTEIPSHRHGRGRRDSRGRRIGRARVHEPQRLCARDRHVRRVRSFSSVRGPSRSSAQFAASTSEASTRRL